MIYPEGSQVDFVFLKDLKLIRKGYNSDYIRSSLKMVKLGRTDFFLIPSKRELKVLKNYPCVSLSGSRMDVHFSFKKGSPWKEKIDKAIDRN